MVLQLSYIGSTSIPIEVEGVTPEAVREKSLAEIERMQIFHGNTQAALADFFRLAGDPSDARLEWQGDLSGVHWIGAHMTHGRIHVAGSAGRHLGSEMRGGEIHVDGDAGDWVGGEMRGGLIHVRGRAGHLIGAAYRGSPRGMAGGTILVAGDAGNEIGHTLRRGLIAIGGKAGDLAGFNMLAGTVVLCGESGIRHGAGMRRGTLAFLGPNPPPVLPSFRRACRYRPPVIPLILHYLRRQGFAVADPWLTADYELYHGDLISGGRGEMLVRV